MHCYNYRVESIEPKIRMGGFFEHTPNHVPGFHVFPPKTYSYGFVILVDLILNR